MLNDFKCSWPICLACGYTDLRRGIDGLAGMVQTRFQLDPFQNALFLFCGQRKNWIKGLYWEENGFVLVYKRLESGWCCGRSFMRTRPPSQVLHKPGKKAQTKSCMWLYRTSQDGGAPIVLYEYQPSRKAEHAAKFLEGFSGYLHADGYQGYHKLPGNIRVVGCWAHARRKFDEALNALLPNKREGTAAYTGLEYCNKLFAWEEQFKWLSPEERVKQRLKEEKPILDALLAWANSISVASKSALGKALHYLQEQWPYLTRYLEGGRLERSIKPFVIGRLEDFI